ALAREVWISTLIQPLLPVFYFVGRRMDASDVLRGRSKLAAEADASDASATLAHVPIVFVHGYMQNRVCFLGLARRLAAKGFGPMFGFNYPWFDSMASNAARLDRFVERICRETGCTAVDLVCHSMGGLVAIEMLRDEARRDSLKVRRCVTIAT